MSATVHNSGRYSRFRSPITSCSTWTWGDAALYTLTGFLLWLVPVFDRLHVESSAVVATVSYFVAGRAVFRTGAFTAGLLVRQLGLLLIPLCLLGLSALWAPNCDWLRGIMFYALFPPITVVFSTSLAFMLVHRRFRRRQLFHVGIGVAIILGGPLYDIGLHPQFYTYNHIFGGVLGPIYDEELVVRPGLFVFRLVTLLWAGFFLAIGSARLKTGVILAAIIGLMYLMPGRTGINTTYRTLDRALPGQVKTDHFTVHFEPASLDSLGLARLIDEHEFRYSQLAAVLGIEVSGRIESYIYPSVDARGRLTGARYTSVAPVWLGKPQLHVVQDEFEQVFAHELTHVFSREFGIPVVNASPFVGLVEGFAVAMEPPDGRPHPIEEVAAFRQATSDTLSLAPRLAASLTLSGFWGGRGAVGYTTTGSFVRHLIDQYGAGAFMDVYAWGNFEAVYGVDVVTLAQAWSRKVDRTQVRHPDARDRAVRRFSVPSLFEARCPHHVPPHIKSTRRAARMPDSLAVPILNGVIDRLSYLPAVLLRAQAALREGDSDLVLALLADRADSLRASIEWEILGDAWTLEAESERAVRAFEQALKTRPVSDADGRLRLMVKQEVSEGSTKPALIALSAALDALDDDNLTKALQIFETVEFERLGLPESPVDLNAVARLEVARAAYMMGDNERAHAYAIEARDTFIRQDQPWMVSLTTDFLDRVRWRSTSFQFAP